MAVDTKVKTNIQEKVRYNVFLYCECRSPIQSLKLFCISHNVIFVHFIADLYLKIADLWICSLSGFKPKTFHSKTTLYDFQMYFKSGYWKTQINTEKSHYENTYCKCFHFNLFKQCMLHSSK